MDHYGNSQKIGIWSTKYTCAWSLNSVKYQASKRDLNSRIYIGKATIRESEWETTANDFAHACTTSHRSENDNMPLESRTNCKHMKLLGNDSRAMSNPHMIAKRDQQTTALKLLQRTCNAMPLSFEVTGNMLINDKTCKSKYSSATMASSSEKRRCNDGNAKMKDQIECTETSSPQRPKYTYTIAA